MFEHGIKLYTEQGAVELAKCRKRVKKYFACICR